MKAVTGQEIAREVQLNIEGDSHESPVGEMRVGLLRCFRACGRVACRKAYGPGAGSRVATAGPHRSLHYRRVASRYARRAGEHITLAVTCRAWSGNRPQQ